MFAGRDLLELGKVAQNKDVQRWVAQFAESQGDFTKAIEFYELAQDSVSTVRLFCRLNDIPKVYIFNI